MEPLLTLFENKCLEAKVYWQLSTLYDEKEFEIEWHRDRRKKWHIREKKEDAKWSVFTMNELLPYLNENKIDLNAFERKVSTTFLQQVVFAKMLYDEAVEFFGEDTVDNAVKETEDFLSKLKSVVTEILDKDAPTSSGSEEKNKKPIFKLVKK